MFQQKPNSGSLFKNNKKSKENQPDYSGSCLIGGQEMKIGAWLKTSKKGEKFFSMSFQPSQQQSSRPAPYQANRPPQRTVDEWDTPIDGDQVPF